MHLRTSILIGAIVVVAALAAGCREAPSERPAAAAPAPVAPAAPQAAAEPPPPLDAFDDIVPAQNGNPLALAGTRLVLGSPLLDLDGKSGRGAAFVVDLAAETGAAGRIEAVEPHDALDFAAFGSALALDADTLAVAAPHDLDERGTVSVFERTDGAWRASQRLDGSGDETRWLGESLALRGRWLAARALTDAPGHSVWLYEQRDGTWVADARLDAPRVDADGSPRCWHFGKVLALDADTVLAGSPGCAGRGAVFVFRHHADGWQLVQTLTSSLPAGLHTGDGFGEQLVVHGDRLYVGAPLQDEGVVAVFERAGDGRWTPRQELRSPGAPIYQFGRRLALDPHSGTLVVGSAETERFVDLAHRFHATPDGLVAAGFGELGEMHRVDTLALAPSGELYAAENPVTSEGALQDVRARRYAPVAGGGWRLVERLDHDLLLAARSDPAREALAGLELEGLELTQPGPVALDGDVLVVGEPTLDEAGAAELGAAHVFERAADGRWRHAAKLRPERLISYQRAGRAVAIRGDVIVVGAPGAAAHGTAPAVAPSVIVYRRGTDGSWALDATIRIEDPRFPPDEPLALELSLSDARLEVSVRPARRSSSVPGRALVFERDPTAAAGFRPTMALDEDSGARAPR